MPRPAGVADTALDGTMLMDCFEPLVAAFSSPALDVGVQEMQEVVTQRVIAGHVQQVRGEVEEIARTRGPEAAREHATEQMQKLAEAEAPAEELESLKCDTEMVIDSVEGDAVEAHEQTAKARLDNDSHFLRMRWTPGMKVDAKIQDWAAAQAPGDPALHAALRREVERRRDLGMDLLDGLVNMIQAIMDAQLPAPGHAHATWDRLLLMDKYQQIERAQDGLAAEIRAVEDYQQSLEAQGVPVFLQSPWERAFDCVVDEGKARLWNALLEAFQGVMEGMLRTASGNLLLEDSPFASPVITRDCALDRAWLEGVAQAVADRGDVARLHARHTMDALAARAAAEAEGCLGASQLQRVDEADVARLNERNLRDFAALLQPRRLADAAGDALRALGAALHHKCAPLGCVLHGVYRRGTAAADVPSDTYARCLEDALRSLGLPLPARVVRAGTSRENRPAFRIFFASPKDATKVLDNANGLQGLDWHLAPTQLFLCVVHQPSAAARHFIKILTEPTLHGAPADFYIARDAGDCLVLRPSPPTPQGLADLRRRLHCCPDIRRTDVYMENDLCTRVPLSGLAEDEVLYRDEDGGGAVAPITSPGALIRLGANPQLPVDEMEIDEPVDPSPVAPAGPSLQCTQITRWFPNIDLKRPSAFRFEHANAHEYVDCDWHAGDWLQCWRRQEERSTGPQHGNWNLRGLLQIVAFTTHVAISRGGYLPVGGLGAVVSQTAAGDRQTLLGKEHTMVVTIGATDFLLSKLPSSADTALRNIPSNQVRVVKTLVHRENKELVAIVLGTGASYLSETEIDELPTGVPIFSTGGISRWYQRMPGVKCVTYDRVGPLVKQAITESLKRQASDASELKERKYNRKKAKLEWVPVDVTGLRSVCYDRTNLPPDPDKWLYGPAAPKGPPPAAVRVTVEEEDCLDVAQRYAEKGTTPLVLNMANPTTAGGGWKTGAAAQEEELCRRTTLSAAHGQRGFPVSDPLGVYSVINTSGVQVFVGEGGGSVSKGAYRALCARLAVLHQREFGKFRRLKGRR